MALYTNLRQTQLAEEETVLKTLFKTTDTLFQLNCWSGAGQSFHIL